MTAGVLQLGFGAVFLVVGGPSDGPAALAFAAAWAIAWVLIGVAMVLTARIRVAGRWRPAGAALGAAAYVTAEAIVLAAALSGTELAEIEPITDRLLPLGALISAVGMVLTGIGAVRARRWIRWRRYAFLVTGLYPFAAMFSAVAVTGSPQNLAIVGWGAAWLLLGLAARAEAHRIRGYSPTGTASHRPDTHRLSRSPLGRARTSR